MKALFLLEVTDIRNIKILELFGGIGAIRKALINLNISHEVIDYVEKDRNCVRSYNTLFEEDFKSKDVRDYSAPNIQVDILMHGSPCQNFSRIGNKKGGKKGSGTDSSLLFETIRIIEEMPQKPTWVIWENVKGVLDKNMRTSFFHYLYEMEKLGYESKYKILNALDFGVPQKRERVFVISKIGTNDFCFDALRKSNTRPIDDYLENGVSDLYTITQPSILSYLTPNPHSPMFKGRLKIIKDYAYTISTKQMRVPNAGIISLGDNQYRYLTERECFRLMGFENQDVDKLEEIFPRRKGCMSSILYKQAGNSIVVDVLEAIVLEVIGTYKERD